MNKSNVVAVVEVESRGYGRVSVEGVVLRGTFQYPGWPHSRLNFGLVVSADGVSPGVNSTKVGGLFPLASVIQSAHYGDLGRPTQVIDVADGDLIEITGRVYRITDNDRYGYPSLVLV